MMQNDDFDKWTKQWADAQKAGMFPKRTPAPKKETTDFFGVVKPSGHKVTVDADSKYWNDVYRLSKGDRPEVLSEDAPVADKELVQTTKSDNKSSSKITDELGGTANPVNHSNRGQDNISKVTPNWAGGKDIIELHNMKAELHKLEDKMAADPMVEEKKTKKVLDQIKSLKDKIDELSTSLNPDFTSDYLS